MGDLEEVSIKGIPATLPEGYRIDQPADSDPIMIRI
tara:strand:+ start:5636 stop:5743 length:108 start_codon:yes stop_codon:yes gene_type:complete